MSGAEDVQDGCRCPLVLTDGRSVDQRRVQALIRAAFENGAAVSVGLRLHVACACSERTERQEGGESKSNIAQSEMH